MSLQVSALLAIAHDVLIDACRVAYVFHAYVNERLELKDMLNASGGVFEAGQTWCLGILEKIDFSRRNCSIPASQAAGWLGAERSQVDSSGAITPRCKLCDLVFVLSSSFR